MKIVRAPNEQTFLVFRKMQISVTEEVADFFASDKMMPQLRREGPIRQFVAVYRAYAYLLEKDSYPQNTAFLDLPKAVQQRFKSAMRAFVAAGLQAGLIKYGSPQEVQDIDGSNARAAARSLVESRINEDRDIKRPK